MKSIFFFFIFLITATLQSMHISHDIFLSKIASGTALEVTEWESITQSLLDRALYIASENKRYELLDTLIMQNADIKSIPAQLALVHGQLTQDIQICNTLSATPKLPLNKALFHATYYNFYPIISLILKKQPKNTDFEIDVFVQLAHLCANLWQYTKIQILFSLYSLPNIESGKGLVLSCQSDETTDACKMLLQQVKPELKLIVLLYQIAHITRSQEIKSVLIAYAKKNIILQEYPRIQIIKAEAAAYSKS